jgi:hypothetical protein
MSGWIAIFLVTNLIYWAIFITLAVRHRPGAGAVGLGVMHMLLAAALSVAPFRSFLDADYPGFVLGVLRFQKRGATLPVALLLLWALASAMILASRTGGWRLWVVAVGDMMFALNQFLSLLQPGSGGDIQFGEYLTISGLQSLLLMAVLFVGGPAFSAWWSGKRALQTAP